MTFDNAAVLSLVQHEADLLNERKLRDWLALYTDDSYYWVPGIENQESPLSNLSLLYEDQQLMEARVLRLESTNAWSNQPKVRTLRMLNNPRITSEAGGEWETVVNFFLFQTRHVMMRPGNQHIFCGSIQHGIKAVDGHLRISWKRVNLLDPEAPSIALPEPI